MAPLLLFVLLLPLSTEAVGCNSLSSCKSCTDLNRHDLLINCTARDSDGALVCRAPSSCGEANEDALNDECIDSRNRLLPYCRVLITRNHDGSWMYQASPLCSSNCSFGDLAGGALITDTCEFIDDGKRTFDCVCRTDDCNGQVVLLGTPTQASTTPPATPSTQTSNPPDTLTYGECSTFHQCVLSLYSSILQDLFVCSLPSHHRACGCDCPSPVVCD